MRHTLMVNSVLRGSYEAFDYNTGRHGVIGLSNKNNLIGQAVHVDEYLGRVDMANASNPAALSVPLTQYAVGYRDPTNLRDVLNRICPAVPAGQAFQYNTFSTKEAFVDFASTGEHKRAMGVEHFNRVKSSTNLVDGSVEEKGLSIFIDRRRGAALPAVRQRYVQHVMDILSRSDIQETITLLDANDTAETSINFGTANTAANPDKTLLGVVNTSGNERGIDANIIAMGGGFSLYRKQSILDAQRSGSTQAAYFTDAELATFLGLDDAVSLKMRRQSTATAKAQIAGADAYVYYASQNSTLEDPSNIKRFYDPEAGGDYMVFAEEKETGVILTVWHANRIVCPSSLGIRKQPVTYTAS